MDLRVVEIDGEPWFVAPDVTSVLYGATTGISHVFDRLASDEKQVVSRAEGNWFPLFARTPAHKIRLISESGLYKLTMRSDKKEAKQFQDWVTREVLPSIRKTGSYTMPGARKTIEAPKGAEAENVPPPL